MLKCMQKGRQCTYLLLVQSNSVRYYYKIGHKLKNGKYVWGEENFFISAPNVGQNSVQRVVIYGDMGKVICETEVCCTHADHVAIKQGYDLPDA